MKRSKVWKDKKYWNLAQENMRNFKLFKVESSNNKLEKAN